MVAPSQLSKSKVVTSACAVFPGLLPLCLQLRLRQILLVSQHEQYICSVPLPQKPFFVTLSPHEGVLDYCNCEQKTEPDPTRSLVET